MKFMNGDRVQLHPATDRWMMGDRYGVVTGTRSGGCAVRVKLDKSGRSIWFPLADVLEIVT